MADKSLELDIKDYEEKAAEEIFRELKKSLWYDAYNLKEGIDEIERLYNQWGIQYYLKQKKDKLMFSYYSKCLKLVAAELLDNDVLEIVDVPSGGMHEQKRDYLESRFNPNPNQNSPFPFVIGGKQSHQLNITRIVLETCKALDFARGHELKDFLGEPIEFGRRLTVDADYQLVKRIICQIGHTFAGVGRGSCCGGSRLTEDYQKSQTINKGLMPFLRNKLPLEFRPYVDKIIRFTEFSGRHSSLYESEKQALFRELSK